MQGASNTNEGKEDDDDDDDDEPAEDMDAFEESGMLEMEEDEVKEDIYSVTRKFDCKGNCSEV